MIETASVAPDPQQTQALTRNHDHRVGIVGIGAMGRGYAKNLLAAGFIVAGFDLDPARLRELEEWGGRAALSPADAARDADWVVTSLPDHAAVRRAVLGHHGAASGARSGTVLIDTSTSLPEQSRVLFGELAELGIRFVDASVSGTGKTVLERDIVVLAGGASADIAACKPVFDAISRDAYHLGPSGSGALGKLVVNVAVVGNRLALAEALAFGMAAGMEGDAVLAILKDGSAYSKAMDLKGSKMVHRDYVPESTLDQSVHGCDLLLEQGRRVGAPLFLTSLYAQIAQVAARLGYGATDPASVIEALRAMSAPPEEI